MWVILDHNIVTLANGYIGVSRRWVFTLNNPDGLITEQDFIAWGAKYLVYQEEVGASGTHHLQGYIEVGRPARFSVFVGLEGAHFEPAMGTSAECVAYCTKSDTRVGGPYTYGTQSTGQGTRADILALRDAVRGGKRGKDLFDDDTVCGPAIRYGNSLSRLVEAYHEPPMRHGVRTVFHFGPPGTGKTFCAHSSEPGAYYFDGNSGGFFIGYTGQKVAVLDEFGGHTMQPLQLQRLCDIYPLWLPVKGGQLPCMITTIHICSNYLPREWWSEKTKFVQDAIYRRISEVHWHYEYCNSIVYKTFDDKDCMAWAMYKFLRDHNMYNYEK